MWGLEYNFFRLKTQVCSLGFKNQNVANTTNALDPYFSKRGPYTSSIGTILEVLRDEASQALSQTYWITDCILTKPPGDGCAVYRLQSSVSAGVLNSGYSPCNCLGNLYKSWCLVCTPERLYQNLCGHPSSVKLGWRTTALEDPGRKDAIRKASWERWPKWLILQEAAGTSVQWLPHRGVSPDLPDLPIFREAGNPDLYGQFLNS